MSDNPLPIVTDLNEAKNLFELQSWLDNYCTTKKRPGWHHYGPASLDGYEASSPKIMLVNAESGGYEDCCGVPQNEYITWIEGGWNTPRYGAVLITAIRQAVQNLLDNVETVPFDRHSYIRIYSDTDLLLENMRPTIYMNARVASNDSGSSREQVSEVLSDAAEFAHYRARFVEVMQPDVVVCAGKSAKSAMFADQGVFHPDQLSADGVVKIGKTTVVLSPHLSRPNVFGGYEQLHKLARECASVFLDRQK